MNHGGWKWRYCGLLLSAGTDLRADSKIFLSGHTGLVGSALGRRLVAHGYRNIISRSRQELDLTDWRATTGFFQLEHPEFVFLAAAKVGGIHANSALPADFIYENLAIETNVIHAAYRAGVKRLLFFAASCVYPRDCPQPMKEEYLLTGLPEPTNRPFAVAKIAGIEMCWAYNRQYGTRFFSVAPANLYGPGDNYDPQASHVISALIRRMHEAKQGGDGKVVVWGSGSARREFLYSDDMADACIELMRLPDDQYATMFCSAQDKAPPLCNIGGQQEISIRELVTLVAEAVGYSGTMEFDAAKPDGMPRKLLDSNRIKNLGWRPTVPLKDGIKRAYADYLQQLDSACAPGAAAKAI